MIILSIWIVENNNSNNNPTENVVPFPTERLYLSVLIEYREQSSPEYKVTGDDANDVKSPAQKAQDLLYWIEEQLDDPRIIDQVKAAIQTSVTSSSKPFRLSKKQHDTNNTNIDDDDDDKSNNNIEKTKTNVWDFQKSLPTATSYSVVIESWSFQAYERMSLRLDEKLKRRTQYYERVYRGEFKNDDVSRNFQKAVNRSRTAGDGNEDDSFSSSVMEVKRAPPMKWQVGEMLENLQPQAVLKVFQVLRHMRDRYDETGDIFLQGLRRIEDYYTLIRPFAKFGQGDRAEYLLDLCIDTYLRAVKNGNDKLKVAKPKMLFDEAGQVSYSWNIPLIAEPNQMVFSMVIDAWSIAARNGDPKAPERAEALLRRMVEYYDSGTLTSVIPNTVAYNSVIHAWSHVVKRPEAPYRALEILEAMRARYIEQRKNGKRYFAPDVITYTTVIHAFAQHALIGKAEEVFEMMFRDYNDNGNNAAKPDEAAFNALVSGLTVQQTVLQERQRKRALVKKQQQKKGRYETPEENDAETLAREQLEEQAIYHTPERAEQILWRMEELCDKGYLDFQPSVWVYSSVLKAWAKSARPDGPKRARKILEHMKERYLSGVNPALRPNSISYNIIIDSYARAGQSKEALEMLEEMSDQYEKGFLNNGPSTLSYTSCISSFGKVKNKYWIEPDKAEEVFRMMVSLNDPKLKPEQICWTSLIDVYAKAAIFGDDQKKLKPVQCLDRAEELLVEMLDSGVEATVVTYNTLLKAIAFSKCKMDRPVRAQKILDTMKERGIRADSYTRNVISDLMDNAQKKIKAKTKRNE